MKNNKKDISKLNLTHPGATDPVYRARRNEIAEVAKKWKKKGGEIPEVTYSETENRTWETIFRKLDQLHPGLAGSAYLKAKDLLGLPHHKIPQLGELDKNLRRHNNFGVEPVEGLVDARSFLGSFERRVMPCSQFIRHHLHPEYTPEPDIVHEVVGHVPMFIDEDFADFSNLVGSAAKKANAEEIQKIERLYWFTIEFGLIEEKRGVKIYGAGLLSSIGEIQHCLGAEVERRQFNLEEIINTGYDFYKMQEKLFVIKSFADLKKKSENFLREIIDG